MTNLVKKIAPIVDNLTESETKRLKLIRQIQEMAKVCNNKSEISRNFHLNNRTIAKYLHGDPEILCRSNKRSSLDQYKDFIIKCTSNGMTQTDTAKQIKKLGESCSLGNIRLYVISVAKQYQLNVTKYVSSSNEYVADQQVKTEYITRKGIFNYLWMNGELTSNHHDFLWTKYDSLPELERCIREFREIFITKNMVFLYLFIERYKKSGLKELASFANGLEKDIEAVENAVASPLSNGFVEGTNSKVKMVKRTMYGRCSQKLLAAKLMYEPK
jgi:hypothetical protein